MRIAAFDLESLLISPSLVAPPIVVGSFAEQEEGSRAISGLIPGLGVGVYLRAMLEGGAHIVGANIAFDMFCVVQEFPELRPLILEAYDRGQIHDVRLREQLLDIKSGTFRFEEYENELGEVSRKPIGYSLAELAKRHLGVVLDKSGDSWRLRYNELLTVPLQNWPEEARSYALDDALTTLGVFQAQEKIGAEYLAKTEADQVRAAFALHALGSRGLCVDLEALDALETQLKGARDALYPGLVEAGIYRAGGTRNMARVKDLVAQAYTQAGDEVPKTKGTDKRAPEVKTSMAVLKEAADPLLGRLAEFAKFEKMLTTFLPAMRLGANFPLTCSYNPLVETGRSSCQGIKWGGRKGPQFQNFPRMPGVRECFIPRPGHVFCSVDYSQLELCTLAQIVYDQGCGSVLRDAINQGRDLHVLMACELYRWPYEEALANKKKDPYKRARQVAKSLNFGFPGGLGPQRFVGYAKDQYGVQTTIAEAQDFRQAWRNTWTDVHQYQRETSDAIEETGTGTTGVIVDRTGFARGGCRYSEALNTPFQSLAASGAKRALWALFKRTEQGLYPAIFCHDEVISEFPIEAAHELAQLQSQIMVDSMRELTPDVKIVAEPALMSRWEKEAETKYDQNGRLVPWK